MAVEEAIAHFPVTRDLLEHCAHCTKTLVAKVFLPNENIVKKSDHRIISLDCPHGCYIHKYDMKTFK